MTVRELLAATTKSLQNDNARFEARQLVMFAAGTDDLSWLIMHGDDEVADDVRKQCTEYVSRRNSGEPLYYIIGKTEFYSLPFYVGTGVLSPRQDTETLVDEAVRIANYMRGTASSGTASSGDAGGEADGKLRVLDLCAGSGCIGIALAKTLDNISVDAVELYDEAYSYLERNVKLNGCDNVHPIKADALGFCGEYDIVVSNPPYVRFDERNTLSKEVLSEPETALFADDNGLCYYKIITENMKDSCYALIFEIGETQGREVCGILRSHGFHNVKTIKDLCGNDRVVCGFSQKYTVK